MMKFLAMAGVIGLLGAGTSWMAVGAAETDRPDCPGTIECPLTGDKVCVDRCPAEAQQQRADCPVEADCPIKDEPIRADRCPADRSRPAQPTTGPPPCCR